jgi:hypothetical protein
VTGYQERDGTEQLFVMQWGAEDGDPIDSEPAEYMPMPEPTL